MKYVLTSLLLCLLTGATPAAAQNSTRPIIRTALEKTEAIPGQPIILRITLLAPTWFPKAPVFPSFEAPNIIVRLPERASGPVSERVGDETWSGVTRAYRLYPMTVGRFRLPPLPFHVTYADPESRDPITIELRTDEILFDGVAPEGTDGLDPFIAATELTLEQTIDGETTDLEPGDAVTREIEVKIEGMSPIFLPELIPESANEGVAAYPKEPVVTESEERGVLSGERAESVIYVGQAGGRYVAPSISLRWFNLDTRQIETAEVPGFDISVKGDPPPPRSTHQWLSVALWVTGVLLLALLASFTLKRLWPQVAAWRTRRREAYLNSEAFAFTEARKALEAHRFSDAVQALEIWSSRLPTTNSPEDAALSGTFIKLGKAFYGNQSAPVAQRYWSEAVHALDAARHARNHADAHTKEALPPLNPRSA